MIPPQIRYNEIITDNDPFFGNAPEGQLMINLSSLILINFKNQQ